METACQNINTRSLLLETLHALTKADYSTACIIDRLAFHAPSQQTKAGINRRKPTHEHTTTKPRNATEKLRYKVAHILHQKCEPVWPSGKALGLVLKRKNLGSNLLRLSFLFRRLWSVDSLVTLSLTIMKH